MSLAWIPDLAHFGELTYTNGAAAADRRSATLAAGGVARTRPSHLGSGRRLASATATSTDPSTSVRVRTSKTEMPASEGRGLIMPGDPEWFVTFDPAVGIDPRTQGWQRFEGGAGYTLADDNGWMRVTDTTSYVWWRQQITFATTHDEYIFQHGIELKDTHRYIQGFIIDLPCASPNRVYLQFRGSAYSAGGTGFKITDVATGGTFSYPLTALTRFHIRVDVDMSGARPVVWLRVRPVGTYAYDNLFGYVEIGQLGLTGGSATPGVSWGSIVDNSPADCSWGQLRAFYGDAWTAPGSAPNREWIIGEITSPNGGVLSEVDIRSDGPAPTTPIIVSAGTVGNSAMATVVSAAGAEAVYGRVEDAGTGTPITGAEAADYVPASGNVVLAVADLAAGTYKLRTWSVSDGGIPSTSGAVSNAFQLPPPVSGTNPPGAVTIAIAHPPAVSRLSYQGGTMRIYTVTPGSAVLNQVTLERASTAAGPFATDSTQTTNPISYSALTFSGSDTTGTYATNHGWTFNSAYWYRVKVTDVDGRASYSAAIPATSQAAYEVTVTGRLDEGWVGEVVAIALDQLVAAGGQEYPTKASRTSRYVGTVQADGSWQVAGLPIGATVVVTFPDGSRVKRVLPAAAGPAAFESLTSP